MLEKHALSDQAIIKCLNMNYGIAATTLIPIVFENLEICQSQRLRFSHLEAAPILEIGAMERGLKIKMLAQGKTKF